MRRFMANLSIVSMLSGYSFYESFEGPKLASPPSLACDWLTNSYLYFTLPGLSKILPPVLTIKPFILISTPFYN